MVEVLQYVMTTTAMKLIVLLSRVLRVRQEILQLICVRELHVLKAKKEMIVVSAFLLDQGIHVLPVRDEITGVASVCRYVDPVMNSEMASVCLLDQPIIALPVRY